MNKVTKREMEQFNEWKDAMPEKAVAKTPQKEIEFDVRMGLDSMPRVIYLRSLGYKIENMDQYAQAEINEMGSAIDYSKVA